MAGLLRRVASRITGAAALIGAIACGASAGAQVLPAGALVVDVRTPEEFAARHFPGAVNIPFDQIGGRTGELGALDRPIVVYCRSGRRSGIAKRTLEKAGFTNVTNGGGLEQMLRLAPPSAEK